MFNVIGRQAGYMEAMLSQRKLREEAQLAQRKAENYAKAAKRAHKKMEELAKAGTPIEKCMKSTKLKTGKKRVKQKFMKHSVQSWQDMIGNSNKAAAETILAMKAAKNKENQTVFDDDEETLILGGSTVEEATTAIPESGYVPTELPEEDMSDMDRLLLMGDDGEPKQPPSKRLRRM